MKDEKLPKPFGTYFYAVGVVKGLWEVVIHASEKGWSFFVHGIKKNEFPKMGQFYESKAKALQRASVELLDLGFTKKEVESITLGDSRYEYSTFPRIYIKPKGSKWAWSCGGFSGVEKTKKIALERAGEHRKDV